MVGGGEKKSYFCARFIELREVTMNKVTKPNIAPFTRLAINNCLIVTGLPLSIHTRHTHDSMVLTDGAGRTVNTGGWMKRVIDQKQFRVEIVKRKKIRPSTYSHVHIVVRAACTFVLV